MKTQIDGLIDGRHGCLRDLRHPKYEGAKRHEGHFIGSPLAEREETGRRVQDENPGGLEVEVNGIKLRMGARVSKSGKSRDYVADLAGTAAAALGAPHPCDGLLRRYTLVVTGQCYVDLLIFKRRDVNRQWRLERAVPVGGEFVKIF